MCFLWVCFFSFPYMVPWAVSGHMSNCQMTPENTFGGIWRFKMSATSLTKVIYDHVTSKVALTKKDSKLKWSTAVSLFSWSLFFRESGTLSVCRTLPVLSHNFDVKIPTFLHLATLISVYPDEESIWVFLEMCSKIVRRCKREQSLHSSFIGNLEATLPCLINEYQVTFMKFLKLTASSCISKIGSDLNAQLMHSFKKLEGI